MGSAKASSKKSKNKAKSGADSRGSLPGFLFFCNNSTVEESLDRKLFGLPAAGLQPMQDIVPANSQSPATVLLLFNFESRELTGACNALLH